MKPSIGLFSVFCPEIKGSTLLSKAATDDIEKKSALALEFNYLGMDVILQGEIVLPKGTKQKHIVQSFHDYFDETFYELSHEGREKLLALAIRTITKFNFDWMRDNRKTPGENITMEPTPNTTKDNNFKMMLTKAATSSKLVADVKSQLPRLLARLKTATKETGKMSALANFLEVPLASVSRWLSGKREPGGEITLKLLQWVEQQERQK